jgi:hypothetical protein
MYVLMFLGISSVVMTGLYVAHTAAVTLLKLYKLLMNFIVRKTRYIFLDFNDTP